jgi:hypothetical protein
LGKLLHPAYPPLPPNMPLRPIPDHEPHYHEIARKAANASARVQLAERAILLAEIESMERGRDATDRAP